jgi:DNA-binding GntR family transcriptional regulator
MTNIFFDRCNKNVYNNIPKYLQLKEAIVSAIEEGYWAPGTQIPAETEIAQTTPFSLGTVQKALKILNEEGIIDRKQGHGTFISKKMFDPLHCRFTTDYSKKIFPVSPQIIGRKIIKSNSSWAQLISTGEESLIQIDRIINVGENFKVYNKFYLPLSNFQFFWEVPIAGLHGINFKKQLRKNYNISITKSSNFVSIVFLTDEICKSLKLQNKTEGLRHEIIACSSQKIPIYYSELYIPPTELKLNISDV